MDRLTGRLQLFALALGGPGLFLVAFLDSSFLSLPEVNDLLLICMVTAHKARMLYYASAATLGSLAGCVVLDHVGRRGEAWLVRRLSARRVEWALSRFQRYGLMAIIIPAVLPPPAPFKIFVVLAGIAGIGIGQFVLAVTIGRGIRYFGEGLLALRYGDRAIEFLRANGRTMTVVVVSLLVVAPAAYLLARWLRKTRSPVNL